MEKLLFDMLQSGQSYMSCLDKLFLENVAQKMNT